MLKRSKLVLLAAMAAAIGALGILYYSYRETPATEPLEIVLPEQSDEPLSPAMQEIGSATYSLEIAQTSEERRVGLSNRSELAENAGMLFVFERDGNYKFWMKDTLIPLDMIWLNSAGQVTFMEQDVQPGSFPETYGPDTDDSRYVIELNAGQVAASGLNIGDTLDLKLE